MGVIDGHDVADLRWALEQALAAERPVVVHIHTVKGKGFAAAEEGGLEGMEKWHAAKPGSIVDRKPVSLEGPLTGRRGAGRRWDAAAPDPGPGIGLAGLDRAREARGAAAAQALAARLHVGVREGARRRGEARLAGDRDHRRDGRRDRPEQARRGASRAVLRRRDRRAGRRPLRLGPGPAGRQAGLRDLLDVPAARLRPDRPRRLPAGAERRLRDGPRRAGRRRRPDPPRRLRHLLLPPAAERRPDGAPGRGDAGQHAADGARLRRRADRLPLPARHRRGRAAPRAAARDRDRHRRGPPGGRAGRAARLRLGSAGRQRGGGAARRARPQADRRRRALRQAARRRADRAPLPPSTSWSSRSRRTSCRAASAPPSSSTSRTRCDRDRARILRIGLPDRYVTHGKPVAAARGGRPDRLRRRRARAAGLGTQPSLGLRSRRRCGRSREPTDTPAPRMRKRPNKWGALGYREESYVC